MSSDVVLPAYLLGLISLIPFFLIGFGILKTKIKMHWITFFTMIVTSALSLVWNTDYNLLLVSFLEGFVLAIIPIMWIIFAAVFTYFISVKTGSIEKIKVFLNSITEDRNIQAVLIAFCFGGFLESVAGFGTAVAIPTGMLVSLGFNPVKAAVISLVANSVPVAFGALGLPVIVLSNIVKEPLEQLTRFVALQLVPFSLLIPLLIVVISNDGFKGIGKSMKDALMIGFVFTLTQTLVAFFLGPELVAVLGSLVSLATVVVVKQFKSPNPYLKEVLLPMLNYAILLVLVILTRLVFPEYLNKYPFVITFEVQGKVMKIDYLTTPGTLLLISSLVSAFVMGVNFKIILETFIETLDKIKWSALTIVSIVILAKVMGNTGMIISTAVLIAGVSGVLYPLFSPLIGAMGTFITGSDTSSNILFGVLQKETAKNLGFNVEWIASSNTSGATAGKMISPQSIAVASSAVGLQGYEKQIISTTLPICIVYSLLLGVYVLIVSLLI
ncbi:MAG: L-lactate permease [Spirochaetia bacterium]|nr:L-lactate permease [Spirochaetota bacterium]MCX8096716.1 L-lactate permease [Spirochaetota bacterium]MDW8112177.1 L-lactate permease [Spirochaetia bacterium]